MIQVPKLELHYYLDNESHSMDAVVRNKCEAELLGLFIEAADALEIDVRLETEAFKEGGLKELWRAIGENNNQLTVLLVIFTIVLSRIPLSNPEQEALDIELSKLQIEATKLQIQQLKKELKK
ncbi:MAG: hypothetical protein V3U87_05825 [Methylococcaceae bacterium]